MDHSNDLWCDMLQEIDFSAPKLEEYKNAYKPRSTCYWSLADDEKLFRALNQFSLDFAIIADQFDDRGEDEIRRRYKRLENNRPDLIDLCLSNARPIGAATVSASAVSNTVESISDNLFD